MYHVFNLDPLASTQGGYSTYPEETGHCEQRTKQPTHPVKRPSSSGSLDTNFEMIPRQTVKGSEQRNLNKTKLANDNVKGRGFFYEDPTNRKSSATAI